MIYEQEIQDGLEEILKKESSWSARSNSPISIIGKEEIKHSQSRKMITDKEGRVMEQFNMCDILVSASSDGIKATNFNDDVFLTAEVWKARHTPPHKQFNNEHEPREVIGHMVSSFVIDELGNVVGDDTQEDKLPESIHVISTSVLYTYWPDDDLMERTLDILNSISEGKKFVSNECVFKAFDYLLSSENESFIVERNPQTAFLTKYLRIYKGSGVYQKYRVGRVLRNIMFTGKGLVDNPANVNSVILNTPPMLASKSSTIMDTDNFLRNFLVSTENKVMPETTVTAVDNSAELASLKAEIVQLKKERDESKSKADSTLRTELTAKIDALTAELTEVKAKVAKTETDLSSANASKEVAEKSAKELVAQLDNIKLESTKASRLAALKGAGLNEKDALAKNDKFISMTDEVFNEVVASIKVANPAKPVKPVETGVEFSKAAFGLTEEDNDAMKVTREKLGAFLANTLSGGRKAKAK